MRSASVHQRGGVDRLEHLHAVVGGVGDVDPAGLGVDGQPMQVAEAEFVGREEP
jgi:hypothetical protein